MNWFIKRNKNSLSILVIFSVAHLGGAVEYTEWDPPPTLNYLMVQSQ